PERKRKIIGNEFIAVFDDTVAHLVRGEVPRNANLIAGSNDGVETQLAASPASTGASKETLQATSLRDIEFLVQGTLYPDVIESRPVGGPPQTINTPHNVGGRPEGMKLKPMEPLKDLFKDEVRRIGRALGMPAEILQRQPFPGPGLAVRILG